MANELTVTISLSYEKGNDLIEFTKTVQSDVAGDNTLRHVQNIGTSEEAITLGDVSAGGYWLFYNLDSTNFVEIRQATGIADLIRLDAGDITIFRLTDDATAPFGIADTAAINLLVIGIDP